MPVDIDRPTLDAQRQHWERMLEGRLEMFGAAPSNPVLAAADLFRAEGVQTVLELGGGQGRDTFFLARSGFDVNVLDFAEAGIAAIRTKANELKLSDKVIAACHDVRQPLPFPDASFDACYSHMLFCMALTTAELETLSRDILRVLKPGGLCVYTTRTTSDADFQKGIHRGEGMYENQGFVVHFLDRAKVEHLARGYEIVSVDDFEEGKLPRRLCRVTLRKRHQTI